MRAIVIVSSGIAALALASCGSPQPVDNQTNTSVANETFVSEFPKGANSKDKALMEEWGTQHEACVGGQDSKPCDVRERLTERLRKNGWCWGAPLSKSAADNDWHHCGDYDTDNLTEEDASAITPIDDGWMREKERVKTPLLQAYENAVEPIYQKIGLSNVMLECGIRGAAWHQQTVAILNAYSQQPQFEEMRGRFTADDAASATRFRQLVIDGTVSFHLGNDKAKACSLLANAPFVHNEAAFRP